MFALDTNILLHYIRTDEIARRVEAAYQLSSNPGDVLISIVTEGEIHTLAEEFAWGAMKR